MGEIMSRQLLSCTRWGLDSFHKHRSFISFLGCVTNYKLGSVKPIYYLTISEGQMSGYSLIDCSAQVLTRLSAKCCLGLI